MGALTPGANAQALRHVALGELDPGTGRDRRALRHLWQSSDGPSLTIRTDPAASPIDGKPSTAVVVWEKVR